MKFKRILAALLGALMITSAMSFTATVGAAEGDIIKVNTYPNVYPAERGNPSVQLYDAEADIAFSRMTPSTDAANAAKSCYINISGQNIKPTAEQIADDSVYVVFYVRTNMTMDDNDNPSLALYNCYWGTAEKNYKKDGTNKLVTGNDNFITKVGNEWGKMCFKLDSTMTADFDGNKDTPDETLSVYKWDQFAYLALGSNVTKPISEWFTSVPEGVTPNVDCAGYAVVTSLEAAEAYDFEEAAKAPRVEIKFDKGLTADDDTDVETAELVIGKLTGEKIEFPEIEAPGEGYEFMG